MANCVFLENSSTVFQMKLEKMCPLGPFSISFSLPGQVDPQKINTGSCELAIERFDFYSIVSTGTLIGG
ncbi:hypothetical protein LWI28_027422 [Acer negundo]|uniref:Uncharacterized protein n=1 Tax=Acer negundo TaxID=4023 RepID=A0AAD5JJQ8_ACENE|nr:hypothetical protein LWI28_027422 [Acer negundo]